MNAPFQIVHSAHHLSKTKATHYKLDICINNKLLVDFSLYIFFLVFFWFIFSFRSWSVRDFDVRKYVNMEMSIINYLATHSPYLGGKADVIRLRIKVDELWRAISDRKETETNPECNLKMRFLYMSKTRLLYQMLGISYATVSESKNITNRCQTDVTRAVSRRFTYCSFRDIRI